jgi:hypothetical protein
MSKEMARLYEKAWNQVVEKQPKWKKDLIVNYQDDDPHWDRVSKEMVHEAIKLAESWEYDLQLSGKK